MAIPQERWQVGRVAFESEVFCNEPCGFCFANFKTPPEVRRQILADDPTVDVDNPLTTAELKAFIIDPYSEMGGVNFQFTGGDPFLRKDLPELVRYARNEKGLFVSIDTNALIVTQPRNETIYREVVPQLHVVGVPLDAPNESLQIEMRGHPLSFRAPLRFLDIASELKPTVPHFPNIKVNTLISGVNYQSIPDMVDVLEPYIRTGIINRWSLDKFLPMERGGENQARFQLSDDPVEADRIYQSTVDAVRQRLYDRGLPMVDFNAKNKPNRNFLISPVGIAYVPDGDTKNFVPKSLRNTPLRDIFALANAEVVSGPHRFRHHYWERELISFPSPRRPQ